MNRTLAPGQKPSTTSFKNLADLKKEKPLAEVLRDIPVPVSIRGNKWSNLRVPELKAGDCSYYKAEFPDDEIKEIRVFVRNYEKKQQAFRYVVDFLVHGGHRGIGVWCVKQEEKPKETPGKKFVKAGRR